MTKPMTIVTARAPGVRKDVRQIDQSRAAHDDVTRRHDAGRVVRHGHADVGGVERTGVVEPVAHHQHVGPPPSAAPPHELASAGRTGQRTPGRRTSEPIADHRRPDRPTARTRAGGRAVPKRRRQCRRRTGARMVMRPRTRPSMATRVPGPDTSPSDSQSSRTNAADPIATSCPFTRPRIPRPGVRRRPTRQLRCVEPPRAMAWTPGAPDSAANARTRSRSTFVRPTTSTVESSRPCEGARLVEDHADDAAQVEDDGRVLQIPAAPAEHRHRRAERDGRRQRQRARAGDDQHRRGHLERHASCPATKTKPASRGQHQGNHHEPGTEARRHIGQPVRARRGSHAGRVQRLASSLLRHLAQHIEARARPREACRRHAPARPAAPRPVPVRR